MVKTKDVPVWFKIITTIVTLICAIWVGGWSASQIYSTNSAVVISLQRGAIATEVEMKLLDKRLDIMEKLFIKQELIQGSLLKGQEKIWDQIGKQNDILTKRIEVDAKLEQWLKSIDKDKNNE